MSIYFSILLSFSFTQTNRKDDAHSHSTNYQNIVTLENARRALSSWYNSKSTAVAWGWIAGRPLGSQPRSNTLTALRHPFTAALCCQGQGEKQCFFATHLEYRAFR